MLHRRPELKRNSRGFIVRDQKQKDRRPAVERFLEKIEEIPVDGQPAPCWRYNGADQFWVNDEVVISPWRFSYEVHNGARVPKGANFRWSCNLPKCCQPEHISPIGKRPISLS